MELHRVGTDVDDGVTPRRPHQQAAQSVGVAGVGVTPQTEAGDQGEHRRRVLRLDSEGGGGPFPRRQACHLRHTTVHHVAEPALGHRNHGDVADRVEHLIDELLPGVRLPRGLRGRQAHGVDDLPKRRGGYGQLRLENRSPQLQAVVADLDEALDVEQSEPELGVHLPRDQEVGLLGEVRPGDRREISDLQLEPGEPGAERPPFPPVRNRFHVVLLTRVRDAPAPGLRPGWPPAAP